MTQAHTKPGTAAGKPTAPFALTMGMRVRMGVALSILGVAMAGLVVRAYVMQLRQHDLYQALAEEQYIKQVDLPPHRGRIFDRIGTELAASTGVDSVYVRPRQVRAAVPVASKRDQLAGQIANILSLQKREVAQKLASDRPFVWLKRRVLPEESQRIAQLNVPGLKIEDEPKRYYPNRSLAGPVLGWAGLDASGLEGIELAYDQFLRGNKTSLVGLRDAVGRNFLVSGAGEPLKDHGNDIQLTLDKFIQFRVEQVLEEGVANARATAGSAVAIDPMSGEILAMASVPTVNPNDPSGARERGARNRPVTDPFEPGSTIKPFTLAAAFDAGVLHVSDEWDCEGGEWHIGRVPLHDADPEGVLTTAQVLARSSNICTAKIARRLGKDKLSLFLRQMGFFSPTGIDLPGERAGQVLPVAEWGDIAFANISFGQGMTATPLQVASALSAIANGGTLYRPHIVKRILSPTGEVLLSNQPSGKRVMSAQTAATMTHLLRGVMEKKGTGEKLDIPGYPVAGKTGTAQKVDPTTHHYSPALWASSFVGFAPYDHPRVLLFVLIDEPKEGHYGAEVAGPIFVKAMTDALRYLGVPPRPANDARPVPPTPPVRPAAPSPPPAAMAVRTDLVPAFVGLGFGQALRLAQQSGLRVEVTGSGRVVSQEPPAHSPRLGPFLTLRLSPR